MSYCPSTLYEYRGGKGEGMELLYEFVELYYKNKDTMHDLSHIYALNERLKD